MKPPHSPSKLLSSSSYICASCLSSTFRSRTTVRLQSTLTQKYPPPPSAAYAQLPSRRLISLVGPDAAHYLQGAITANISATAPRSQGFYTAFLTAQGRVLNDVFIYPSASEQGVSEWLIEVDAKEAERLVKHIRRYKLRAKFNVRLVDEGELNVWSLWKDGAGSGELGPWTKHSLSTSTVDALSSGIGGNQKKVSCEDNRAPGMGRRLILPAKWKPEEDVDEVTEGTYTVRRYLKGVPEGQDEIIREAALPQESNIDYMGGIDYRKGCYVGQELTIRTHHTGVVRKRILPVMLYGKDDPTPDSLEYNPDQDLGVYGGASDVPRETNIGRFEKRGRAAGKWLTGVGNLGLGLCRLEIMANLSVPGEAGCNSESDEFKLEWDADGASQMVKIKAFVPSWHLTK